MKLSKLNAKWPITKYTWVSNIVLAIRFAHNKDSEYDSLLTWYETPLRIMVTGRISSRVLKNRAHSSVVP
ncbi:hypothetical protein GGGNBK_12480 [Sporosarcina sp. ANT_H38]